MRWLAKATALFHILPAPATSSSAMPDELMADLSEPSGEVVGGITDAFLGNSQISGEQRRCLSKGASSFASSLTEACEQALQSYKQVTAPPLPPAMMPATNAVATGIPATNSNYDTATASGAPAINPFAPSATAPTAATPILPSDMLNDGLEALTAIQLAASLSRVYKMESKIARSCLKGDLLDELEKAEKHLSNMTYVGGRLITEGIDVMDELSVAFTSFEHQNYRAFGKNLGTAGRKILLSKGSGPDLNEPSEEAIEEMTSGLFSSFIGKGFDLQLVADAAPAMAPTRATQVQAALPSFGISTAAPPLGVATQANTRPPAWLAAKPAAAVSGTSSAGVLVPVTSPITAPSVAPGTVNVDLHKCITENMPFWKSAWSPVWELASAAADSSETEVPGMSDLMMSVMDLQMAMTRCEVSPEMEAMLIDSVEKGKLHAKLKLPQDEFYGTGFTSLLSSALEDFHDKRWRAFGAQLGAAMQELVVVSFSQKYEVDGADSLRHRYLDDRKSWVAVTAGAVSVGFLTMVAVLRSRRAAATALSAAQFGQEFNRFHRAPALLDDDLDVEAIVE